jgi:predicted ATPase
MARAGALAEVDSVLAAARAGRGTLVAVTGEPGIGKTRLAEAAADRAALAGPARDPGGGPADPEGARSQLSFDLAEVIAAAARPVLVVIDDAHQADPSSLRLLAELGPALRAMPAAVLVTARDGDQAWQGRLDERGALLRSGLVITLPPFTADDVAGLVASPTGAPPAPDLVRVIAERSAGNPLLVTELTRQLSRQGGRGRGPRGGPRTRPGDH